MTANKYMGSTFESWLDEEGIRSDVELGALKKIIVHELSSALEKTGITLTELAKRMGTSRAVVHRLLEPAYTNITLDTLIRASNALNVRVDLRLKPRTKKAKEMAVDV